MMRRIEYRMDVSYTYKRCAMAVKSVSIRIEEEMLDKLSYVADYDGRSLNSHILVLPTLLRNHNYIFLYSFLPPFILSI